METIQPLIPYGYEFRESDEKNAKEYLSRREKTAQALSSLVDALMKDAAEEITKICYRYGIDPQRFTISSAYNEKMFDEVAAVLDQLEEEIMDLTLDYATRCTEDKERKKSLLPWILLLGRGNRNLQQTLETRIKMFVKDLEALIVSMSMTKHNLQEAVTKIKSSLHTVYVTPEVRNAFNRSVKMQAKYIREKGIKHGNVGNSNSEANNILRFVKMTVQMAWMKSQIMDFGEQEAVGYVVRRGSNYPCDLCDSHVGYHDISDTEGFPQFHGHCLCIAIPVFKVK